MSGPLMPKGTAVWLLDNTALTFAQIADFCNLHVLEVENLANEEGTARIMGLDPITNGQLTMEEIDKATQDPAYRMQLKPTVVVPAKKKGTRYTPIAQRQDKPNAISWLIKHYPDFSDMQIVRLIGTTKSTIAAIRDRTHWNIQNIRPQSPVLLGICTQAEIDTQEEALKKKKELPEKKKTAVRKKKSAVKAKTPAKKTAVAKKEKAPSKSSKKTAVKKKAHKKT